jgi:CubicO group peptidase (beta-lactamase class C family)
MDEPLATGLADTAVARTPFTAPDYERVAAAFAANLDERRDLGAAFAAFKDGRLVVDLWGGVANRATGERWAADTHQIVFSGSKGLVAVCILMLVDSSRVDLDARVSSYWPEFAAGGKKDIRVRDVMAHRAGVPGISTPLSWEQATESALVARLLAEQPRSLDPRAARTYHALTYGWILGEVVKRVDGRSVGHFFADEVARPLDLDLWIGLPSTHAARLAHVEMAPEWEAVDNDPADSLLQSVSNPLRFEREHFPWNELRWLQAEVPAANAVGSARSMAKLYANLDRLLKPATIEQARRPLTTGQDTLSGRPIAFGLGFQLQNETKPFGPPVDAFGHGGAGGSRHGYWPEQRIAFSYAMNLLRQDASDVRGTSILEALFAADLDADD